MCPHALFIFSSTPHLSAHLLHLGTCSGVRSCQVASKEPGCKRSGWATCTPWSVQETLPVTSSAGTCELVTVGRWLCCLTWHSTYSCQVVRIRLESSVQTTLGVPHWCSLQLLLYWWNKRCHSPPPDAADYARLSGLLWLRATKVTSISNLPSFKGVFGGIFSLLSCWKALEGSKRLMPCTAHSCSWRLLLVCFSLASNARSFETS